MQKHIRLALNILSPGEHTITLTAEDSDGNIQTTTINISVSSVGDSDGDKVGNEEDKCPYTYNPNQIDFDNDGSGDTCDDSDSDGFPDNIDNCLLIENDQADIDNDGVRDVCDEAFDILWDDIRYPVSLICSSIVSDFNFNQTQMQISFNLTGESSTAGYCNTTIPKSLLKGNPWTIIINEVITNFEEDANSTHSFLYFTYTFESSLLVVIRGTWIIQEFSPTTLFLSIAMLTLVSITLIKLRKKLRRILIRSSNMRVSNR